MNKFNKLLAILLLTITACALPSVALADPVSLVLTMATTAAGGTLSVFAAGAIAFATNLVTSVVLSSLAMTLSKKDAPRPPGITSEGITAGGDNPQNIIFGYYATGGNLIAPPMSHGYGGDDIDNYYLTRIIDIADHPIEGITKYFVDGIAYDLNPALTPSDPGYDHEYGDDWYGGRLEGGSEAPWNGYGAYVRPHLGNQTAADAKLVDVYSTYPQRPWTADHKLLGVAYVVHTWSYEPDATDGIPATRYEVKGAKLYDPRKDSTNGGSGSHRYNNPSTHEFTTNPVVMIYNILRGFKLPNGKVYGYRVPNSKLQHPSIFAAMNVCDEDGTQPDSTNIRHDIKRYQAGFEFKTNEDPSNVIDVFLAACGGKMVEVAGEYRLNVGPPSSPVMTITDEVLIKNQTRSFTVFDGLADRYNGVKCSYPKPSEAWEVHSPEEYVNDEWVAEDAGRERVADLSLNAVYNGRQARRLMRELAKDNRKQRAHEIVLGPMAFGVMPLDTIRWTSEENGYENKLFEVVSKRLHPIGLWSLLTIREVNPTDYDYDTEFDSDTRPDVNITPVNTPAIGVRGLTASPLTIKDNAGNGRKPAIKVEWNKRVTAKAVIIQITDGTDIDDIVYHGTETDTRKGFKIVSAGITANNTYRVRARAQFKKRKSQWSDWIFVTTPDIRVGFVDLAQDVLDAVADLEQANIDAQAAADAAQTTADTVTTNHNNLVSGFVGNLTTAFGNVNSAIRQTTFPSDWQNDGLYWSHSLGGNPSTKADLTHSSVSYVTDTAMGKVLRHTAPITGGNRHISPKEYLTNIAGERYRVTIVARHNGDFVGGSATALRFNVRRVSSTYSATTDVIGNTLTFTVKDVVQVFTYEFTADGTTPFLTPFCYINLPNFGTAGPSIDIASIEIVNITAANNVSANLATNYYTKTATDGAIAASSTTLNTRIGNVESNLATNYYTSAATNSAISASATTLSARINDADGEITDIKGLNLAGLNGSNLGVLLTQLNVNGAGTSATISSQGTAITTLQGNAEASYVLRAKAGSSGAQLELVAADDPISGGASVARISADDIILDGSVAMEKLVVTDLSGNLVPNGSFIHGDLRGWDNIADTASLVVGASEGTTAGTNSPTKHILKFDYSADWKSARCVYDTSVTAGEKFAVKFDMATSGATRDATMRISFYFYNKAGSSAGTATLTESNYNSTAWKQVSRGYTSTDVGSVTVPSGAEFMRVTMGRFGGGAGAAYVTNLEIIKKRAGSTLIEPSGITTDLIDTTNFSASGIAIFGGTLQSTGYATDPANNWRIKNDGTFNIPNAVISRAKIADAAVGTLKIGDNAVSTIYSATGAVSTDTGGVSVTINPDYAAKVTITAIATDLLGITWTSQVRIKRNGTVVSTSNYGGFDGSEAISIAATYSQTLAAGTSYTFRAEPGGGARAGTDVQIIAIMTYK